MVVNRLLLKATRPKAINGARSALELVPCPKRQIIEVLSRHGLVEKRAGIEDSVVSLKIGMPVDLPSHFHPGLVPNKTCKAVGGRSEQETRKRGTRNAVHAVG